MAKLGDICTVNMGQSPDSATYNEVGRGLPFFQGNADFGRLHPAVRVWCSEPTKIAHTGDILISVRAPIGAMNVADQDCCIGRGLAAIRVNENICDPQYLWYAIQSKVSDLNVKGTGSTFKAISKSTLTDTEVLLVPLDAQKNIASVLSNVENSILFRKEQLTKLDELIKARFVEMFGDLVENPKQFPCVLLGSIMTVMPQNGLYKPQSAYVQDKFGTPILRIDGFYNGKVTDFNNLKRLCCTDFEKERYLLVENDILINRVNSIEYLGKCARISGLQEDTVFESNMMRFHLDDSKVNSTYITTVLCSQYIYRQILTRAKKAVNQASINQGDVQSLNVVVPPLSLQNQFADFVAEVDKSKLFAELFAQSTCILAENHSK